MASCKDTALPFLPPYPSLSRVTVNALWLAWNIDQCSAGSHGAGALKIGVLVYPGSLLGTPPNFSGLHVPWATHCVNLPPQPGFSSFTSHVSLVPHEMLS